MSLQTFIRAIKFTSFLGLLMIGVSATAEWSVDFSRRAGQMGKKEYVAPVAPVTERAPQSESFVSSLFQKVVPTEEVVVLNTEQGFVPSTIRLREGLQYRFTVVNINEKSKNVSFIMDAFAEHHATFYGQMKSFYVIPKKEGIFSFVSPETSAQGRIIVQGIPKSMDSQEAVEIRSPASRE